VTARISQPITIALAALLLSGCVAFDPEARKEAFEPARVELGAIQGRRGPVEITVATGNPAKIGLEKTPYELLVGAGAASVPLAVVNPFYVLGVFIPIIGGPANARFNSRRETLTRAVAEEPLTAALLRSLERDPALDRIAHLNRLDITINAYGLAPRSGTNLSTLGGSEPLCLGGAVVWRAQRNAGGSSHTSDGLIALGTGPTGQAQQEGLPVPAAYCRSIGDFAADDGRLLREAIRELAEVFAALIVRSLESK